MARGSLIPGFRFHPTDVELVMYYLKRKLLRKKITINAIAEVNIYDFSPWDLPDKSSLKSGDLEWYFFCPKSKKYSCGSRSKRSTEAGFWKATGKDRTVQYNGRTVATIKTLVFHVGHAGRGQRTDWVMHEYKMEDENLANAGVVQDMYVLCKVYEKSGSGPKNGAHYGKPFDEEEWGDDLVTCIDSGIVGASNNADNAQMCPATMSMTDPCSSIVTFSGSTSTNKLNNKQKGPATIRMTEPGSSIVMFSPNQPTNTLIDKQKGPAAMTMTEPGSSIVTFSSTQRINRPNDKQKGPSAYTMTEPGSSIVMFSSDQPTNTFNNKQKGAPAVTMTEPSSSIFSFSSYQPTNALNDKRKGAAVVTLTEPSSSIVSFSSYQPTNTLNNKHQGAAAVKITEPSSSIVSFSSNQPMNTLNGKQIGSATATMTESAPTIITFSADQPTNTLNNKQKGPAAMNMDVPQATHDDVMFFEDFDLPADDVMFFEDDVMFFEDIYQLIGSEEDEAANLEEMKSMVPKDDCIYDDLVDLIDLEELNKTDFKTDIVADYRLDKLHTLDDLDAHLGEFFVD